MREKKRIEKVIIYQSLQQTPPVLSLPKPIKRILPNNMGNIREVRVMETHHKMEQLVQLGNPLLAPSRIPQVKVLFKQPTH
jgi:hypothetical protein